ncbi:DUF240 domain-containing protein [Mycoplasmoides genitalium]
MLDPRNFNVIDIFHLLSGFKSGIKKTVDLLNRLQSSINETNKIFPINDEDKLPKVPQNFFKFLNENFFPQLHPKGLNITESIVEIFNQYNLKKIQLKDFNLELVKKMTLLLKIRFVIALKSKWILKLIMKVVTTLLTCNLI